MAARDPASAVPVTVLSPIHLIGEGAAERLAALDARIDARHVPYQETMEHRVARKQGRFEALAGLRFEADDADLDHLRRSVAVLALDVPVGFAELAPAVRLVQASGAGIEWLDPPGLAARGVTLANASGVAAGSIAEFVLGRVLEVYKEIRLIEAQQRERRWAPRWARELAGDTMGVVGLGAIGRAVARRARAFEMTVLGARRSAAPGSLDPDADQLYPLDRLDELLAVSDVVVLAAPSTPDTDDLFDAARFAAMKPGSVFVNVSRGSLVDEAALLDALKTERLRAAVLDVAKTEPAPADSPLWDAPNVYLSPHCSASLDRYADRLLELFADNVARLATNSPLRNVVDPAAGY